MTESKMTDPSRWLRLRLPLPTMANGKTAIEVIGEDLDAKQTLLARLEPLLGDGGHLAPAARGVEPLDPLLRRLLQETGQVAPAAQIAVQAPESPT